MYNITFYYEMILYDTVYCQISLQIRPLDLRSRLMQHCDTQSTFSFWSFMKRMNFLSGRNFYRISNAQINPRFSNSFSVRWNEALVIEAWIYRWLMSTGHDWTAFKPASYCVVVLGANNKERDSPRCPDSYVGTTWLAKILRLAKDLTGRSWPKVGCATTSL